MKHNLQLGQTKHDIERASRHKVMLMLFLLGDPFNMTHDVMLSLRYRP